MIFNSQTDNYTCITNKTPNENVCFMYPLIVLRPFEVIHCKVQKVRVNLFTRFFKCAQDNGTVCNKTCLSALLS